MSELRGLTLAIELVTLYYPPVAEDRLQGCSNYSYTYGKVYSKLAVALRCETDICFCRSTLFFVGVEHFFGEIKYAHLDSVPDGRLSRGFIGTTGRLRKPGWPLPTPDKEFVRNFGAVRIRPRGGLSGWVGENEICEAARSIRLAVGLTVKPTDSLTEIPLRVALRRFFFDGLAVGKFELGLATKSRKPLTLNKRDIRVLFERFLLLKVRIRQPNGTFVECPLISAGRHLAYSYLTSTTQINFPQQPERWWVRAGSPLLFLVCGNREQVHLPYYAQQVDLPDIYDFELHHCVVPHQGDTVRMWFLDEYEDTHFDRVGRNAARRLRIYLQRLHAEHECLRLILRNVMAKTLLVVPRSDASAALQNYFNESIKRIGTLEAKSSDQFDQDICEIAQESVNLLNPGQLDALKRVLASFDLRPNILSNVEKYMKHWGNVTIIENVEENYMGDVFKDINQSIIITRGSIAKGVNSLQISGNEQIAEAISQLDQLIAAASDSDLEPEKKKECSDLLRGITEEANRQEPNKYILRSFGNTLSSILTSVKPLAKAAMAAFDILKSLWS